MSNESASNGKDLDGPMPLDNWLRASYRTPEIPELKGNVFASALVPPRSHTQWLELLQTYPPVSAKDRELPNHTRAILVRRVWNYFEPLERHAAFALDVEALLAWAYLGRDPLAPPHIKQLQAAYESLQAGGSDALPTERNRPVEGLTLLGPGGSGKSATLQRVLAQFPQRLFHAKHGLYQVVYVMLDFPSRVGAAELVAALYAALAKLAPPGTMPPLTRDERANTARSIPKFALFALQLGLGLIVIDEVQNITPESSGGSHIIKNTLQNLANLVRIPFVLVGTLEAMEVLGTDLRAARRVTASGDRLWGRLLLTGYNRKDQEPTELEYLLDGLLEMQLVRKPTKLSAELTEAFYEETQGVVALLVMLFMLAQIEAIRDGSETLTPESVRATANKRMRLVKGLVDAYRKGDPIAVAQFERRHSGKKVNSWARETVEKSIDRVEQKAPTRARLSAEGLTPAMVDAAAVLQDVFNSTRTSALAAIQALGERAHHMNLTALVNAAIKANERPAAALSEQSDPDDWRVRSAGLEGEAARNALRNETSK